VPAHLLFLEWISSDRLVFVSSPKDRGPTIVAVNTNGSGADKQRRRHYL